MKDITVIFDMDGVIADTNPFHVKAFKAFFDRYKIQYNEDEFISHMYGKHNSYIMEYFFKRKVEGEELLVLEEEKEALFREIYEPQVQALPGFLEFFSGLKNNNIKTAVATSAPKANLDLILGKLNILNQMDSLMASENVTYYKPHPEIYLKSLENLNSDASEAFVFEDSYSGATAGLAAGAHVIGVLSSHKKSELPACHAFIKDFKEIDYSKLLDLKEEQKKENA